MMVPQAAWDASCSNRSTWAAGPKVLFTYCLQHNTTPNHSLSTSNRRWTPLFHLGGGRRDPDDFADGTIPCFWHRRPRQRRESSGKLELRTTTRLPKHSIKEETVYTDPAIVAPFRYVDPTSPSPPDIRRRSSLRVGIAFPPAFWSRRRDEAFGFQDFCHWVVPTTEC